LAIYSNLKFKKIIINNEILLVIIFLHRQRMSYYAVFDGHSGVRASDFCATRMHMVIAERFPKGILMFYFLSFIF
jgi:serine/threonine protein phosphatase PrpC